jgi:acyl carrier protein
MTIELIEDVVRNTVTRITRKDISQFTRATTFKDLEADSLDIVQILVALEDHFDIEVVDEELESITNMGDFIDYIDHKVEEKTARSA